MEQVAGEENNRVVRDGRDAEIRKGQNRRVIEVQMCRAILCYFMLRE